MSIADSLARLEEEIARACAAAGRDRREITLIAVTKTYPAESVREAHAAGVRHVGENRVQELLGKKAELEDLALTWHLIGSLQTNKVHAVLPHIGLLHSLDRPSLVEAIAKDVSTRVSSPGGALPPAPAPPPPSAEPVSALIQVNTTAEETKSGVAPEDLDALVDLIRRHSAIRLLGFMTIGPLDGDESDIRRAFALLRSLRDRTHARHPDLDLDILSMGMSDDFSIAIQEGATHLRIGSRIFGARG